MAGRLDRRGFLKGTAGAFIVNLGATVPVRGLVLQADTDELVLIEVQCGPYLGEDDIVRLADTYGRA